MARFFDYDALTGVAETFDYDDDTDTAFIHSSQDVEPLLARQAALRNSGLADQGIKRGFWLYANVPLTVILAMKKKGIDFYARDDAKKVMAEIDEHYPYLKATTKRHDR